ncbi:OmpA family protein [Streptomyces zagrosensis]|uniref:Outer membrane protein OmpA-like peptidoglycan-associated protein n=1 Tax=Streptomyces zagrosensis TaxID=1042984 RepID=A0A7W9QDM4_9ACTN|nr:OmpA family protein [Streptomyces zagrosensis]MBB5938196.1 outer membrane protein OmpA-like peptidoglycan-associated protein [Streptomyces zagrosensis]
MTTAHTLRTALLVLAAATAVALPAPAVHADEGPGASQVAAPPVEVDPDDADLKLASGAKLGEVKVLNIKSIVETDNGEERREDTNEDVTFALQSEVLFGKDSAKLSPQATARITIIAREIDAQRAREVRIFGFTDDLGATDHGEDLSKERADAVQQRLAGELGSGVQYEIRGYGEDYPIADNSTEAGRKKNRRVEVSFAREAS